MNVYATRPSLLIQVRDASNKLAWAEFVNIYTPLLYGYALKSGLQDSDAADLTQDCLRQVVRYIERFEYAEGRGSFRGWLLAIARNLIRRRILNRNRHPQGVGDTAHGDLLRAIPSREETDRFELEYRRRLFEIASERVRGEFKPATWEAFWLTSVQGFEAVAAAEKLSMSVGAVYIARSRVLARLREEVAKMDEP